jgi:hypothetical protein
VRWKPKLTSAGRYPVSEEGPSVPTPPRSSLHGPGSPYDVGALPWKGPIPRGSVCEIVKGPFDWRGCEELVGRICSTKGPQLNHPKIGPCYLCHVPALGRRAWIATPCLRVLVPILEQPDTPAIAKGPTR